MTLDLNFFLNIRRYFLIVFNCFEILKLISKQLTHLLSMCLWSVNCVMIELRLPSSVVIYLNFHSGDFFPQGNVKGFSQLKRPDNLLMQPSIHLWSCIPKLFYQKFLATRDIFVLWDLLVPELILGNYIRKRAWADVVFSKIKRRILKDQGTSKYTCCSS